MREIQKLVTLFWVFAFFVFTFSVDRNAMAQEAIEIKSALVSIAESVEIPVERAGILVAVNAKTGQSVQLGQLIAKVKDASALLTLDRARHEHELAKMAAASEVDLQYSKKSYDVAVADVQRSEQANLRVANSVPTARLEKQKLERDRTELKLQQARRDLEMAAYRTRLTSNEIQAAQLELAKTEMKSPMAGLVVSIEKRVGEWVDASEVICKVVRTDRLRIEGMLHAKDARRIKVGTPVKVRFIKDWADTEPATGEVVFVSPEANPVNSMVQVRAEFANDVAKIPAGIKADIVIEAVR